MNSELKQDILTSNNNRASFYRFLASIFLYELTNEQIEKIAAMQFPDDQSEIGQGYATIAGSLHNRDEKTRQTLAVDYAHVFLGAGIYDKLMAPPYESVYTSEDHILMQEARDGALAFYRSEELDMAQGNDTPEDHVGYEMQFMAEMIDRASQALSSGNAERYTQLVEKQHAFFSEHLANWLEEFSHDIDKHCSTDFYHGVAALARGLVASEQPLLDELVEIAHGEAA